MILSLEVGGWTLDVGGGGPGSIESRTSDRECSAIRHAAFARVHSIFPEAYYPTLIRPWCTYELKTNVLSSSEPPRKSPGAPCGTSLKLVLRLFAFPSSRSLFHLISVDWSVVRSRSLAWSCRARRRGRGNHVDPPRPTYLLSGPLRLCVRCITPSL